MDRPSFTVQVRSARLAGTNPRGLYRQHRPNRANGKASVKVTNSENGVLTRGVLTDVGINDRFMKEAAQHLQSGNAALFLLIRKMTTDKVLAALQGEGGTVIRTSFDESKEEALRTALAGAAPSVTAPAG